jgi:chorismate mutase
VRRKAEIYGQELVGTGSATVHSTSGAGHGEQQSPTYKLDPQVIADLYERWVMPLTKEVQISYLLGRLD